MTSFRGANTVGKVSDATIVRNREGENVSERPRYVAEERTIVRISSAVRVREVNAIRQDGRRN